MTTKNIQKHEQENIHISKKSLYTFFMIISCIGLISLILILLIHFIFHAPTWLGLTSTCIALGSILTCAIAMKFDTEGGSSNGCI